MISNSNHHNQVLVEATYQLVAEQGLSQLTPTEIARRAGISETELNACFPTKEALVQAVVDYLIELFSTTYAPTSSPNPTTPLEEIRMHFENIRYQLAESPEQFMVFAELNLQSQRDPKTYPIFEEADEKWFNYLQVVLEEGIEQGQFRPNLDVNSAAQMIMILFKGTALQLRPRMAELDKMIVELESWLTGQ